MEVLAEREEGPGRPSYEASVRLALKDFHAGDRLAENRLVRSALVRAWARSSDTGLVEALRALLREASRGLGACGRDAEHARVLEATFFAEPRKQRAVADDLAMSWSTYRRRLGEATRRIAATLWALELRARAPGDGARRGSTWSPDVAVSHRAPLDLGLLTYGLAVRERSARRMRMVAGPILLAVAVSSGSGANPAALPSESLEVDIAGYRALVEVDGELRLVPGESLVVRLPKDALDVRLYLEHDGDRILVPLAPPEQRGEHVLVRAELEDPPAEGRLILSRATGETIAAWQLAPNVVLPAELRDTLARGDDEASAAALRDADADLAPRVRLLARIELAKISQRGGSPADIIAAWERAAESAIEAGVPTEASRCLRAAAYHALFYRRFDAALTFLDHADTIDRRLGHESGMLLATYYRSRVLLERGQYREAVRMLRGAAEEAWSRRLDAEHACLVESLAVALQKLGRYEAALAELERAAPHFLSASDWFRYSYESDRGWVLLSGMEHGVFARDFARPRRHFERARALASTLERRDFEALALANLLWVAYLDGDLDRASSLLAEMDRLDARREGYAGLLADTVAGNLRMEEGDLAGALAAFGAARERALDETSGAESDYSWRASYGIAQVLHRSGDESGAIEAIDQAIAAMLQVARRTDLQDSRALFLRDRALMFADAVAWSLQAGRTSLAFELAELAHTDLLRTLDASLRAERLDATERHRFEALRERYLEAQERFEQGRTERDLLAGEALRRFDRRRAAERVEIAEHFERAYAYLDQVAPIAGARTSADAVVRGLSVDEALVSFVRLGDRTVTFLARSDGVTARWVAGPTLAPWRDQLDGITRLYVVAAAPDARDLHRTSDPDGEPWLAHFAISYVPHAAVLERGPDRPRDRSVVAGDPDDDLPHARAEASRVASRLEHVTYLAGRSVTRRAVLDAIDGAAIFHFAGHGQLEGDRPWNAHLDLSDGETLTVEDLLVSRPDVGVVVLAGCETGEITGPEGIGLADAFVLAGARSVVAADGLVDDDTAKRFVDALYDEGVERDPMAAYRRAALADLRAGGRAWRAFRVLGLGRGIADHAAPFSQHEASG